MKFLKSFVLIISALILTNAATAEEHYDANHCEIFADKILAFSSSHGIKGLTVFLKTINDRLDGKIEQVGARYKTTGGVRVTGEETNKWYEVSAKRFVAGDNYWPLVLSIDHDYTNPISYEIVFFVKTDKGITYWAKAKNQSNFIVDLQTYKDTLNAMKAGRTYPIYNYETNRPEYAISTQNNLGGYYNPGQCY